MKKIYLLFALFLVPGFIYSQPKKIMFDFDYASYAYDSTSNYFEIYYSFGQNSLTAVKSDTGYSVDALLKIEIQDTATKKYVVNKEWKVSNHFADSAEFKTGKSLIGVISFVVPRSVYNVAARGRDGNNTNNVAQFNDLLSLRTDYFSKTAISDIELASSILQDNANKNSIFYKNSLEVVPIPTCVFGVNQPMVYYYSEIYNLKPDTSKNDLKLTVTVLNSRRKTVSTKEKPVRRINESRVEVGTVNVSKYPSDTYTLMLSLVDTVANKGVTSSKKFFVYNPHIVDTMQMHAADKDIVSSDFGVMSLEECDDLAEKSRYISTPVERSQYAKLKSVEGKRDFLYQFWKKRDTDPSTPKNEFYVEYLDRVQQSNDKFGSLSKIGWKTDRGRVFITYGEPNEIERYPNQVDKKPYEIWQYHNIEGGVIFVFADLTGFSDYTLIHSTMRGELQDDTWERRVNSL